MRSLYQLGEFLFDLDQIVWIKISKRSSNKVRFKGIRDSFEFSDDETKELQEAWIAYKGKFDPKKER